MAANGAAAAAPPPAAITAAAATGALRADPPANLRYTSAPAAQQGLAAARRPSRLGTSAPGRPSRRCLAGHGRLPRRLPVQTSRRHAALPPPPSVSPPLFFSDFSHSTSECIGCSREFSRRLQCLRQEWRWAAAEAARPRAWARSGRRERQQRWQLRQSRTWWRRQRRRRRRRQR